MTAIVDGTSTCVEPRRRPSSGCCERAARRARRRSLVHRLACGRDQRAHSVDGAPPTERRPSAAGPMPRPELDDRPPASATTATPATSCGSCVWASRRRCCCSCWSELAPTRATAARPTSADGDAARRGAVRQLLLGVVQVVARRRAGGRRAPSLVVRRRWRRLGTVLARGRCRCGRRRPAARRRSRRPARRRPRRRHVARSRRVPVAGVRRRGDRRVRRRQAVAVAALAARRRPRGPGRRRGRRRGRHRGRARAGAGRAPAVASPAPRSWSRSARRTAARAGVGRRGAARRRARRRAPRPARGRPAAGPSCTGRLAADGAPAFVKVYGQDSRDADLLYRGVPPVVLRGSGDEVARRRSRRRSSTRRSCCCSPSAAGSPARRCAASWPLADGSMVLAMDDVGGRRLDELPDRRPSTTTCSSRLAAGRRAARGRARPRLAARRQRPGRRRPRTRSSSTSASARRRPTPGPQAIDRAELLASLAALVGPEAAVGAAAAWSRPRDLAAAMPYLQPLALSAATRRTVVEVARCAACATAIADGDRAEPVAARAARAGPAAHARHDRRRSPARSTCCCRSSPTSTTASTRCARPTGAWLAGALVMSVLTYVAAAIGMMGGVRERPAVRPHRAGRTGVVVRQPGHAGERRRDGAQRPLHAEGRGRRRPRRSPASGSTCSPAASSTSCCSSSSSRGPGGAAATAFAIPSSSTLLVVIAVVLAVAGAGPRHPAGSRPGRAPTCCPRCASR